MERQLYGKIKTGQLGEKAAAKFLIERGYQIIATNWRCRVGEMDIIARHEQTIVFVEVRTRKRKQRFGLAIESVDDRKQHKLRTIAQVYMQINQWQEQPIRFDVIAVQLLPDDTIETVDHIIHAF